MPWTIRWSNERWQLAPCSNQPTKNLLLLLFLFKLIWRYKIVKFNHLKVEWGNSVSHWGLNATRSRPCYPLPGGKQVAPSLYFERTYSLWHVWLGEQIHLREDSTGGTECRVSASINAKFPWNWFLFEGVESQVWAPVFLGPGVLFPGRKFWPLFWIKMGLFIYMPRP